jgi:predicted DNA-binding transcriptional regulator AlpA
MAQEPKLSALLGKAQLCELLAISERTIEGMVKNRQFPPPVRVGKHVYWTEAVVRKWQQRLFAAQENWEMH